jgi:hypothetical protein
MQLKLKSKKCFQMKQKHRPLPPPNPFPPRPTQWTTIATSTSLAISYMFVRFICRVYISFTTIVSLSLPTPTNRLYSHTSARWGPQSTVPHRKIVFKLKRNNSLHITTKINLFFQFVQFSTRINSKPNFLCPPSIRSSVSKAC